MRSMVEGALAEGGLLGSCDRPIARKIGRKALKTWNPRPGFRRVDRRSLQAVAPVGDRPVRPRPGARAVTALALTGPGADARVAGPIARKIGRKALKTWNPRPGFRRVDRRSLQAVAPVGDRPVTPRPGAVGMTARALTSPGANARTAGPIARKIGRKALKTWNPRPGFRRVDRRSLQAVAPVGDRPVTPRPGALGMTARALTSSCGRGRPGRSDRPENRPQGLENTESAPGISAGRSRKRTARRPGWGSPRNAQAGRRWDNGVRLAGSWRRRPPGRSDRPENRRQDLENMESAPGIFGGPIAKACRRSAP